jgi:integrase
MSNHIERRANLWYATLTIPKDARETIGKMKFIQSLGTANKREAITRAAPLVSLWKSKIEEARGNEGAVDNEALRWKGYLANAKGVELHVLEETLLDKAKVMEAEHGEHIAGSFYQIAMGYSTPLNSNHEKWKDQLTHVAKTKDQMIKDVDVFLNKFQTIERVTKLEARNWINEIIEAGNSVGTAKRILMAARNYWGYLRIQDVVGIDNEPLTLKGLLPTAKKTKKKGWIPFDPSSIVTLWKEANLRSDQTLADLIFLGAYTGARIEEICSLKLENLSEASFKVVDSKTNAGIREVPIHSELIDTIKRLKESSQDGYLLTNLTFNKYGDRSNNLGKRFGKLKTSMGFSTDHVFHSIRKTLVTLLENAGVSEGVTADIVGHEKKTMTYGLYSGGNSLTVKKEAIDKVKYPFN